MPAKRESCAIAPNWVPASRGRATCFAGRLFRERRPHLRQKLSHFAWRGPPSCADRAAELCCRARFHSPALSCSAPCRLRSSPPFSPGRRAAAHGSRSPGSTSTLLRRGGGGWGVSTSGPAAQRCAAPVCRRNAAPAGGLRRLPITMPRRGLAGGAARRSAIRRPAVEPRLACRLSGPFDEIVRDRRALSVAPATEHIGFVGLEAGVGECFGREDAGCAKRETPRAGRGVFAKPDCEAPFIAER